MAISPEMPVKWGFLRRFVMAGNLKATVWVRGADADLAWSAVLADLVGSLGSVWLATGPHVAALRS
jgi:hypothetical protein